MFLIGLSIYEMLYKIICCILMFTNNKKAVCLVTNLCS